MKRRNDIYNVGNDYDQTVSAYFRTTQAEVDAVSGKSPIYSDGLFHYTQKPAYELSGGKDALNKRVINNLPQSNWEVPDFKDVSAFSAAPDASAVFSKNYATVEDPQEFDWANAPITKK